MIENQKGSKIKIIRTDNGLEFCNKEFAHLCNQDGILRHLSVPGNPKQNGLPERMNRTLLERVRCMIIHARLSKSFQGEAISMATYVINRSPSRTIGFKTPYEMWTGQPSLMQCILGYLGVQPMLILSKASWTLEQLSACLQDTRKELRATNCGVQIQICLGPL